MIRTLSLVLSLAFVPALRAAEPRLFFTSQGKTAIVNPDGSGLKYFAFDKPGQATWQPGPILPDGHRVIFLSMEPRRDGPGKPFAQFYHKTPTHLWLHDLDTGSLDEVGTKDRIAPFETPALFLGNGRMLVQVVRDQGGQIFSMNLDGGDPREFTRLGEGLPYGFSLRPDGKRIAFHLASPAGYQVWTSDLEGGDRVKIAAQPNHLYFGTNWSPDGNWVVYVDCHDTTDHGHDWADVCIGRADGSEHKVLTSGQAMWFAATYGDLKTRGGGSNIPGWTKDGCVLFPRRTPGAKVPWEYREGKPDLDHFNRDFKPEAAQGGTQICKIDPRDGKITELTKSEPGIWDFRGFESPDGRFIAFCRAKTGGAPSLWVMDSNGKNPRELTKGINDLGADHPRWIGR